MKELETLKVVIDAVIRPYKEKMNAIKKETSDAMKQVDALPMHEYPIDK